MSDESIATLETCDADDPGARQKEESSSATSPNRWVIQLAAAGLAVCLASGATFHYTARGVFARAATAVDTDKAPRPVDPMRDVVSLEHGMAVYAANCATCHGPGGL